jgi:hypothetical protein
MSHPHWEAATQGHREGEVVAVKFGPMQTRLTPVAVVKGS